MNHPGHVLVNGLAVARSSAFPPFVTPQGVPRAWTQAEQHLRGLPWRRDCFVNKILQLLDVREQYRQAVLIVERGNRAAMPCNRCSSTAGEKTFQGCYFAPGRPKCAECTRNGGACTGALRKVLGLIL